MPIGSDVLVAVRRTVAQTLFDMSQKQAISNVVLVREPTAVTVKFDTVHPALAAVEIFHMVHGVLALDMEKENLARTALEFGNPQDRHAVFLPDLEQEHRYWFRISVPRRSPAQPKAKDHVHARGEFFTPRRDTFVDLEQLHIVDDSDTLSAGDLLFTYALYDATLSAGGPRLIEPRSAGEFDRDSGEDIDAPFGAGVNVGRAPDRIGVYVDGQDDDTSAWAGPWQGFPLFGMRPPDGMPARASSASNIGADTSDALGVFRLRRFLGRDSLPFDFPSAVGALRFDVRGRFITEVSDTLGRRVEPPWKTIIRTRMRLAGDGRMAGMAALPDGRLGLALLPDGSLSRQAAGPRGTWAEVAAPAFSELLVQPMAAGGLLLLGTGEGGRLHLATLADPRRETPRWQDLDLAADGPPLIATSPDGVIHLLATDGQGVLWHARVGTETGGMARIADGVAGPPVAAVDGERRLVVAFTAGDGDLAVVTVERDGTIGRATVPGGDFPEPLAIVADGAGRLLVATDTEDRVAARRVAELAGEWESLGPLDELLEGPTDPVALDPPSSTTTAV